MKQKYDAWLEWVVSIHCNLNCSFCVCGNGSPYKKKNNRESVNKIDIPALLRTLEKTGKIFKIGFSGGEPFLIPNFIEVCRELIKKHYISLNTNLTSKKIKVFCEEIDPERVLYIHTGIHIEELEKHKLCDRVLKHLELCSTSGYELYIDDVAYPPLYDNIRSYRNKMQKKGFDLFFTPFNGIIDGKVYPRSYTRSEIAEFGLDMTVNTRMSMFHQYHCPCNAGYNMGIVSERGNIFPCFQMNDRLGNIYTGFSFKEEMGICPFLFCQCPLNKYDAFLYDKAKKETKKKIPINNKNIITNKKKYCIAISSHWSQFLQDKIIDIGHYQVITKHVRYLLPTIQNSNYDIIQLNFIPDNIAIARTMKKKLGASSQVKIVFSLLEEPHHYGENMQNPELLKKMSENADGIIIGKNWIKNLLSKYITIPIYCDPLLPSVFFNPHDKNTAVKHSIIAFTNFLESI